MPITEASVGARPVVIGAGWSGLACAIELVRRGRAPLVLDAAPQAGGRARAFGHDLGGMPVQVDNGQHLLLGAYGATLELLEVVGVDVRAALWRQSFALHYPDGWRLAAAPLPAPWHLAVGLAYARGVTLAERCALLAWVRQQAASGWRREGDAPASTLFDPRHKGLLRRLWRPLCLAALNVEPEQASARIFLNVLRDSLGAGARASELLLPRSDLSRLFPEAAVAWLRARGAEVRLHCPVQALDLADGEAAHRVHLRDASVAASALVLALPPDRAHALLAGRHARTEAAAAQLRAVRSAPIATVYLRYRPGTRLVRRVLCLPDLPDQDRHGQWVFDRGALDPAMAGVLSVVISGDGPYRTLDREALAASVARQLRATLGLPDPLAHYAIVEKHATIVPAPGLQRPAARLPLRGLFLAGDAADSEYPSTLEGSVRSGLDAARALLDRPH